jgi:hypothetical protein
MDEYPSLPISVLILADILVEVETVTKNGTQGKGSLRPFDEDDDESVTVFIETPKGSRNKYLFDPHGI